MSGLEVDRPGIAHERPGTVQRHIRLAYGVTASDRNRGGEQGYIRIKSYQPLGCAPEGGPSVDGVIHEEHMLFAEFFDLCRDFKFA